MLALLVANAILAAVGIASSLLERSLLADLAAGEFPSEEDVHSSDLRQAVVGGLQGAVFIFTAVFFIAWLHRAYRNLPSLGATQRRFGEGWAVGGWFVPILSLWRPKEIVNDVWRASDPAAPSTTNYSWRDAAVPRILLAWWLAFLAAESLWNIAFRWTRAAETLPELRTGNTLYVVSDAATVLAALLAVVVVRRTTRRQTERATALGLAPEEDPVPVLRRRSTWAAAAGTTLALALQGLLGWAFWTGALDPATSNEAGTGPGARPPGMLVTDDFSSRAGGWAVERTPEVEMGYAAGKYRIRIKEAGEWFSFAGFPDEVDAVRIDVAAQVARGARAAFFGVGCWQTDDVGYLAVLFPDGFWAIVKDPPRSDRYRDLAGGPVRRAPRAAGAPNRLQLDCHRSPGGVMIELSANGTKVGEARDSQSMPPFRALSLFAGSDADDADVLFDDVSAREIEG